MPVSIWSVIDHSGYDCGGQFVRISRHPWVQVPQTKARRKGFMTSPLERFLCEQLADFRVHLEHDRADRTVEARLRGAEQFAAFMLGRPPGKHDRTVGTVGAKFGQSNQSKLAY